MVPRLGLKLGWGGFQLLSRRYIPVTVQDISYKSQLISNMKSYMGFQFMQKSITLNDQNTHAVTGKQTVICYGRNVRFMIFLADRCNATFWYCHVVCLSVCL